MEQTKKCSICLHKPVCKIVHGEMIRRFGKLRQYDIIKEVEGLEKELGTICTEYKCDIIERLG